MENDCTVTEIDSIIGTITTDLTKKINDYSEPDNDDGYHNEEYNLWEIKHYTGRHMINNNMGNESIMTTQDILNPNIWIKIKSDAIELLTNFKEFSVDEQINEINKLKEYWIKKSNNEVGDPSSLCILDELIKKYFPNQKHRLYIYITLIELKNLKITNCTEDPKNYPKNYITRLLDKNRRNIINELKPLKPDNLRDNPSGMTDDEFDILIKKEFYHYYESKDYDTKLLAYKFLTKYCNNCNITEPQIPQIPQKSLISRILAKIGIGIGGNVRRTRKYKRNPRHTARKQRKPKQFRSRR